MLRCALLFFSALLLLSCSVPASVSSPLSSLSRLWPWADQQEQDDSEAGQEVAAASRVLLTDSECRTALSSAASAAAFPRPASLELLNWNIGKTRRLGWAGDLQRLSLGKHLVLLQEATDDLLANPVLPPFRDLAPGFSTGLDATGVATFSRMEPDVICHLRIVDAVTRLPRATQITRYPFGAGEPSLAVANIHMTNINLDFTVFRRQLDRLVNALEVHDGPVIVSGDFNTWTNARYNQLSRRMDELGARAVGFPGGGRSRFVGEAVDHVFVVGLRVEQAQAHEVDSSDHNPLSVRLAL